MTSSFTRVWSSEKKNSISHGISIASSILCTSDDDDDGDDDDDNDDDDDDDDDIFSDMFLMYDIRRHEVKRTMHLLYVTLDASIYSNRSCSML